MAQQVLAPNVATSLVNVKKIIIGVGWDVKPNPHHDASTPPIDLDASITCFDAMGQFVDSIYFGNLMNANRSIIHTGDNKSGAGEGHDEEIIMQLDQIPAPTCICVLTIHSYTGDTFEGVQRAFVRVMNADTPGRELEMGMFSLSAAGPYTSMIMGKFYRSPADGSWIFHTIGQGAQGRSFGATLPIIQGYLRDLIPNIVINPTPNIVVMTKGESVPISKDPSGMYNIGVPISRVTFALGWDMMGTEPIDLDGSCVLFDARAQNTEAVYFNHKQSSNGAIRHSGDDRSGDGDDDDELIFVDLPQIPANVTSLFFIVNSYSAHKFSRIKNAYVRIIDGFNPMGTELMRFSLSEAMGSAMDATAMIMCKLYRRGDGQWMCKALGYATQGRTWNENIADMTKEIMGRLPNQPDGFRFQPVPPRKQRPQQQHQQQQYQQQQPVDACCTML